MVGLHEQQVNYSTYELYLCLPNSFFHALSNSSESMIPARSLADSSPSLVALPRLSVACAPGLESLESLKASGVRSPP